jgi:hypothetical protein
VAIVWDDVVARAPALSAVAVETQDALIEDAYAQLSEENWGTRLDLAAIWLCAHLATLSLASATSASAGPVLSEQVGPVSRTYSEGSSSTSETLSSTAYGREFQRLQQSCLVSRLGLVA